MSPCLRSAPSPHTRALLSLPSSVLLSGHVPQKEYHDVLNQDLKKNVISGYAGHIPHHRQTYGKSFDKTVEDAKHMDDPEVKRQMWHTCTDFVNSPSARNVTPPYHNSFSGEGYLAPAPSDREQDLR